MLLSLCFVVCRQFDQQVLGGEYFNDNKWEIDEKLAWISLTDSANCLLISNDPAVVKVCIPLLVTLTLLS